MNFHFASPDHCTIMKQVSKDIKSVKGPINLSREESKYNKKRPKPTLSNTKVPVNTHPARGLNQQGLNKELAREPQGDAKSKHKKIKKKVKARRPRVEDQLPHASGCKARRPTVEDQL